MPDTHPSPTAVFGLGHILSYWVAFIKANGHRVPNCHA
uniref:Uncharacterized protein n=1 Tax=Anguilla anguilla TaxID=7936 RepID=A0A0E9RMQ2_ANGAN